MKHTSQSMFGDITTQAKWLAQTQQLYSLSILRNTTQLPGMNILQLIG